MADLTYIRLTTGFVFLAVVLDAWSRRVIGYAISHLLDTRLCLAALDLRQPRAGLVHHSDRGVQGEFKRSSQHLRKEEELRWRQASADGRIELCVRRCVHPGRPTVGRREHRQRFWEEVARGLSSEESAVAAGVSPAVGARWFRQCGGMPPFSLRPLSGRYLSFVEREEIAVLQARGCGVREIARQLRRSSSTISRELRRNAATRSGNLEYRATTAQWHADRRAKRPKVAKLAANGELRQYVQDRLGGLIAAPDGAAVPGPNVRWVGRRRGRRQDPAVGGLVES